METELKRKWFRTVERLETEKTSKQKDRVKFEEDLEQVEEMYRKEISELRQSVKVR